MRNGRDWLAQHYGDRQSAINPSPPPGGRPLTIHPMSPKERIDAVLAGETPDQPPFSFWYHFPRDQVAGRAAVDAHIEQLRSYGLDFLKVMNDNPYPHTGKIQSLDDLASVTSLRGDEEGFGRQLELIRSLRAAAGTQVYMSTTIFNAWAVLRSLIQPPAVHNPPDMDASADVPSRWIREGYARRPQLISSILITIADNLSRFAAKCIEAGADGIFLSVRDDWVDVPGAQRSLYQQLVLPTDLIILRSVQAARFNLLHVCGKAVDFKAFAGYPVAVMNWADRAAGPAIKDVAPWLRPAIAAGVDNLGVLLSGTPQQVRAQVADAISQASPRPLIITPGCTFDPKRVPVENLRAMADAARSQ